MARDSGVTTRARRSGVITDVDSNALYCKLLKWMEILVEMLKFTT